jgi:hypothetical protein
VAGTAVRTYGFGGPGWLFVAVCRPLIGAILLTVPVWGAWSLLHKPVDGHRVLHIALLTPLGVFGLVSLLLYLVCVPHANEVGDDASVAFWFVTHVRRLSAADITRISSCWLRFHGPPSERSPRRNLFRYVQIDHAGGRMCLESEVLEFRHFAQHIKALNPHVQIDLP